MFPALPPALAFPLAALAYIALILAGHRRYGLAMTVYYGAWLLLWGGVTVLWGWLEPSRWAVWGEAVQRSALGTVIAAGAMVGWMRGPWSRPTWSQRLWGWRGAALGVVCTLAFLHSTGGWIAAAGWGSAAAGVLGASVASFAVFLGLLRWAWWVEQWEDMIAAEIGRWVSAPSRKGLEVVR